MPAVEVEQLVKRYAGRAVVDGLSLRVERGEVFCILGPNGAGKTTTVEILEGFRGPDGGTVRVLGLDPHRDARRLRPRIGVMPQEGRLYARIRPSEAARQFSSLYDDALPPAEILRIAGLEGPQLRTPFRRLSGGEQQRLSFALALAGRPELAFLDEPTAGMDAHARARTWEVVAGLKREGRTVLLTTHLLDEAERVADRIAIVHRGRLVALGTPSEIVSGAGAGLRFRADAGLDMADLSTIIGAPIVESRPGEYRSEADASPDVVARLTAWFAERGVRIGDLTAGRRGLEEVFLELTREDE